MHIVFFQTEDTSTQVIKLRWCPYFKMLAKMEENNQWREAGLKRKYPEDRARMRGEVSGRGGACERGEDEGRNRGREAGERGEDGEGKRGGAGGRGGGEGGGAKKRLDALSVGYFRRVGERLSEGFTEDEEKGESPCTGKEIVSIMCINVCMSIQCCDLYNIASHLNFFLPYSSLCGERADGGQRAGCPGCHGCDRKCHPPASAPIG